MTEQFGVPFQSYGCTKICLLSSIRKVIQSKDKRTEMKRHWKVGVYLFVERILLVFTLQALIILDTDFTLNKVHRFQSCL